MKKLYEVPAMEIVRLDVSENIAKLPVADSAADSTSTNASGINGVTTTIRTKSLAAALLGSISSNTAE